MEEFTTIKVRQEYMSKWGAKNQEKRLSIQTINTRDGMTYFLSIPRHAQIGSTDNSC